ADQMGVTAEEASKMASAGKVDFETFQRAMEKGLGGAAQESGKTFAGAMANMKAALGRLGASFLGGVFDKMPGVFSGITGYLDKLGPAAEVAGEAFSDILSEGFDKIAPLARKAAQRLGDIAAVGWDK